MSESVHPVCVRWTEFEFPAAEDPDPKWMANDILQSCFLGDLWSEPGSRP
jgi:hypothetical protein